MVNRACEDCDRRRGGAPWWRFDPACFYCGVAYLHLVRSLGFTSQRLEKATAHILKTWAALGHNQAALMSAAGG